MKRKASFIPDVLSCLESPRTSHFNRFLKFLASLYGIASSLKIETTHTRVAVRGAAAGDLQKGLEVRFEKLGIRPPSLNSPHETRTLIAEKSSGKMAAEQSGSNLPVDRFKVENISIQ